MAGFLGLPTAVVIAPFVAGAVGLLGRDPARLLIKMACILFAVILTGLASSCSVDDDRLPYSFSCFRSRPR
jgi:hypothetical protein